MERTLASRSSNRFHCRGSAAIVAHRRWPTSIGCAQDHRTTLDVGVEAANAYVMLQERRRIAVLLNEQMAFARDVVSAANACYAGATAPQADVLRAEVEVARLEAVARALVAGIRGAEAMLNTSLAIDADTPVPPLAALALPQAMPSWSIKAAFMSRPELAAARADIARADADVQVMRDMFRPMTTIRTGPSYTMAEGRGWMAMVGFSLPIWRSKPRAGVAEARPYARWRKRPACDDADDRRRGRRRRQ